MRVGRGRPLTEESDRSIHQLFTYLQQSDLNSNLCQAYNVTIIKVYAPNSTHDDHEGEEFYEQLE